MVHHPRIDIAEPHFVLVEFLLDNWYVFYQPEYLEQRKITTRYEPYSFLHVSMLLRKGVSNVCSSGVAPNNGIVERFTRLRIPCYNGFSLVSDTHSPNAFRLDALILQLVDGLIDR